MNVTTTPLEGRQIHIHARNRGAAMAEEGAPTRAEVCVVACAEAWRGDGAILASPMGLIPTLGAKLAQLTFSPGLLLTDGEATLLAADGGAEGWLPYRGVFTMLAAGLRHVMMGAAQLDRFGNQNISCIGDHARPEGPAAGRARRPGQHDQPPGQLLGAPAFAAGLRRARRHGVRHRLRPGRRARPGPRPVPRAAARRDQPGGAGLRDRGPRHAAPLGPPGRAAPARSPPPPGSR